jgi:hypothetical protein
MGLQHGVRYMTRPADDQHSWADVQRQRWRDHGTMSGSRRRPFKTGAWRRSPDAIFILQLHPVHGAVGLVAAFENEIEEACSSPRDEPDLLLIQPGVAGASDIPAPGQQALAAIAQAQVQPPIA